MNEHRGLWCGKRLDNGEWVEGYLSKSRNAKEKPAFLKYCIDHEETGLMMSYIVAPETLGECTGLRDKNKKLIFEGHIVKYSSRYKQCVGEILFSGNQCRFIMRLGSGQVFEVARKYANCYEIIGNIHDNPELLQKGAAE